MGCGAILAGLGGSLALDAGGGYLGYLGGQQSAGAMNTTTQRELNLLNQAGQSMQGIEHGALAQSTPQAATQDIQQGQSLFTNAANSAQHLTPGFATPLSAKNTSAADARADLGTQAMGNYAGYSNLGQQWGLQNQINWPMLGVYSGQAAAAQNLYPQLMQIASRAGSADQAYGQGLQGLGSLLGSVTGMAGMGGMSGIGGILGGSGASAGSAASDATANANYWASPYTSAGLWTQDVAGAMQY